ncbi:MAG: hypothetical protein ACN4GM_01030 [Gammaproteobacteria bacterium]
MVKSLKAAYSTGLEYAISRRNLHLSNLLSFRYPGYSCPIKKMTTENTDLELLLDAVLDDEGHVTEISIKH